MKKGDMSMGVIIGAAIALLILVLLSVLILRSGVILGEGTSCEGQEGAVCIPDDETCSDYLGAGYVSSSNSCSTDERCCIPFNA